MKPHKLIQNALFVPEKDVYLKSGHVHDYVCLTLDDGVEVMTDGGLEYVRRSIHRGDQAKRVHKWDLYSDDPIALIRKRLLWGCRGIKGDQPLFYRPIALLELDHLKAIIKTQLHIKGSLHEQVIKWWIAKKKKSNV